MGVYTHLYHFHAFSRRVRQGLLQTLLHPVTVYQLYRNCDFRLVTFKLVYTYSFVNFIFHGQKS
jgi:hypothetical protein